MVILFYLVWRIASTLYFLVLEPSFSEADLQILKGLADWVIILRLSYFKFQIVPYPANTK